VSILTVGCCFKTKTTKTGCGEGRESCAFQAAVGLLGFLHIVVVVLVLVSG
jgi:hypothetical protein